MDESPKDKKTLFRSILLEHSRETNDYKKAATEWNYYTPTEDNLPDTCICGTPIVLKHGIVNVHTGDKLIVGSECIKRFGNSDVRNELKLRLKMDLRDEKKHRLCIVCCDYRVSNKEPTHNICKSCYKEGERDPSKTYLAVFGKSCEECDKAFLPSFDAANLCRKCYSKSLKKGTPCPRCKEKNIPPGKEYLKMCSSCASSEDCKRLCHKCNKCNISGNSPSYVKFCNKCSKDVECRDCGEFFKEKWKNNDICPSCYKIAKEFYKECFTCGEKSIPPESADTECKKCIDQADKRQCTKCGLNKISPKKPDWVKLCDDCSSIGKVDRKCPTCENIIPARDHWKPNCTACYIKSRK